VETQVRKRLEGEVVDDQNSGAEENSWAMESQWSSEN
jgi:hypothetical protein